MRSEERLSGRSTAGTTCPARQSAEVGSGSPRTRDELRPVVTAVAGGKPIDNRDIAAAATFVEAGRSVGRTDYGRRDRVRYTMDTRDARQ